MKIFKTIKEGLKHRTHCVKCNGPLTVSSKSKNDDENIFIFLAVSGYDEAFAVNRKTEIVSLIEDPKLKSKPTKKLVFDGQFWTGLYIDCEKCYSYGYTLQLKFDTKTIKLFEISLNSETITFEENDLITEVRNMYGSNESWFMTYDGSNNVKSTKLPLIQFNLDKPAETLARVRKLIIFS
jgi:hypothetical protein